MLQGLQGRMPTDKVRGLAAALLLAYGLPIVQKGHKYGHSIVELGNVVHGLRLPDIPCSIPRGEGL